MDLLAYVRVLRRHWVLVLILVLVGGALGAASTQIDKGSQKRSRTYYKASNTLVLDTASSGSYPAAYTNLDQIALLATTGDVPDAVAKKIGGTEIGRQLAEQITTLTNGSTNTLDITAVDPDAQQAVKLANAFADALVANVGAKEVARYNQARDQIIQSLDSLQTQIAQLDAQLAGHPANSDVVTAQRNGLVNQYQVVYANFQQLASAGTPTSRLSTLESAQALPIGQSEYQARLQLGQLGTNHLHAGDTTATGLTSAAASDNSLTGPASRGALGALLGLLAGIGLAVVFDRLDRRIRNREDAEAAFDLPVLADVPRLRRSQERERGVVADDAPLSRAAEAYRAIRSSILFQHASVTAKADGNGQHGGHAVARGDGGGPLVVMITSAVPKEGKTTTTANLAAVFAEAGSSVLVVNCDFRRPTIHRHFGVPDEARRVLDTRIEGVKLVSSVLADPGANPAQIVAAQRQVIAAARARFDVILLDTAPLLTANDAVELVSAADLVLLVARSEATNSDNAQQTMALLTRLDAPVFGVVLVGASAAPNQYYYYYNRSTAREIARFGTRAGSNGGAPGEVSTRELFGARAVASTDER